MLAEIEQQILVPRYQRHHKNGRGEIRTPETGVARLLVFKTSAFNRSATLPGSMKG